MREIQHQRRAGKQEDLEAGLRRLGQQQISLAGLERPDRVLPAATTPAAFRVLVAAAQGLPGATPRITLRLATEALGCHQL
jgi:hypothetical protein